MEEQSTDSNRKSIITAALVGYFPEKTLPKLYYFFTGNLFLHGKAGYGCQS